MNAYYSPVMYECIWTILCVISLSVTCVTLYIIILTVPYCLWLSFIIALVIEPLHILYMCSSHLLNQYTVKIHVPLAWPSCIHTCLENSQYIVYFASLLHYNTSLLRHSLHPLTCIWCIWPVLHSYARNHDDAPSSS